MGTRIKLLLVVAALALLVVVSATAAPAGAAPKKQGSKEDACSAIQEHANTETVLELLDWC